MNGGIFAALERIEAGQEALRAGVETLRVGQDRQQGELDRMRGELDRIRVDLMARMDRVQDTLKEQGDDLNVLLDLLATYQRIAERAQSEARLALDGHSSTGTTLTRMERQIRRLQEQMRELRGES